MTTNSLRSLNLEAATHVHLMEPHWNHMVEAQAAARVDRLDQTNDIVICRYIVKESIEEVTPPSSPSLYLYTYSADDSRTEYSKVTEAQTPGCRAFSF